MTFRAFSRYWLPVLLWAGVIFWMSTGTFSFHKTSRIVEPILYFFFPGLSKQSVLLIHGVIRKAGHLTEYFVLGILLFRGFRGGSVERWKIQWAASTLAAVLFCAAGDEIRQFFSATRTASLKDVGLDLAGGFCSQVLVALRHRGHLTQPK